MRYQQEFFLISFDMIWFLFLSLPHHLPSFYSSLSSTLISLSLSPPPCAALVFPDKEETVIFINLEGGGGGITSCQRKKYCLVSAKLEAEGCYEGNHLKGTDPWAYGEIKVMTWVFWFMLSCRLRGVPLHRFTVWFSASLSQAWVCRCHFKHVENLCLVHLEGSKRTASGFVSPGKPQQL